MTITEIKTPEELGFVGELSKADEELFNTLRLLDELNNGGLVAKFEEIIKFLEGLYIQNNKDWIVTYSGGKDSSLVLSLVFKMLMRLPKPLRTKRVHVVSSDTRVETYQMTTYLKRNLELIKQYEEELNLEVHLVQPDVKNSFFWNVIGRGVIAPKPPSPFQWCTKKMKINPMNGVLDDILSKAPLDFEFSENDKLPPYDVVMMVGSRLDESARRANNINKLSFDKENLFGINPDYSNVRMCYPIKHIETSDLWAYITSESSLPWGLPTSELYDMYSDGSGECPMTKDELTATKGCGSTNSRNGCWVCLYSGRNDQMLDTLVSSGHKEVQYLSEWKQYLFDVTFDVRYRESFRRIEINRNNKRAAAKNTELSSLFDLDEQAERDSNYEGFERANKTDYTPGGFTFELRLKLLQKLLYTQKMVGYELISSNEIIAIVKAWESEGYSVIPAMITPINHIYDGALILNTEGKINLKETKNSNPAFIVRVPVFLGETELISYIKERQQTMFKSYYCFLDNKDYNEIKFVYNYLNVLVCEEEVTNQQEALDAACDWLFIKNAKAAEMTSSGFSVGVDMLLLSALEDAFTLNIDVFKPTFNTNGNSTI